MAARIMFTITNQYGSFPVPYSLYWLTVRQCGSRHQAHKLFWDARDKRQPIAYLRKKIIRKWHVIDTVEMDYNKPALEAWVEKTIFNQKPKPKPAVVAKARPDSIENILKGMGL